MLIITVTIYLGCTSGPQKESKDEVETFVATVDTSMTLMEVAKLNNIGEPYLRTELGIPPKIGKKYTVAEMSRRFHFSIDDLKKVIEDRKNYQKTKNNKKSVKKSS